MVAVAPGDPAPDFRLRHTFDRDVGLQAALATGPVLLAFYVFDFGFV
jgi:peroxiredoxin